MSTQQAKRRFLLHVLTGLVLVVSVSGCGVRTSLKTLTGKWEEKEGFDSITIKEDGTAMCFAAQRVERVGESSANVSGLGFIEKVEKRDGKFTLEAKLNTVRTRYTLRLLSADELEMTKEDGSTAIFVRESE